MIELLMEFGADPKAVNGVSHTVHREHVPWI